MKLMPPRMMFSLSATLVLMPPFAPQLAAGQDAVPAEAELGGVVWDRSLDQARRHAASLGRQAAHRLCLRLGRQSQWLGSGADCHSIHTSNAELA